LTKNILKEISKTEKVKFREWVEKIFKCTKDKNVPLIIISASWIWKKSIEYFLDYRKIKFNNVEIISNDFIWDKTWKAIDYIEPIIHSFNKSETVLKNNKNIYSKIKNRKNVLLLWDSLWDHHMVDWFDYKNLIKIWFLNDNEEELLSEYKKRYDIIITWDWDFDIVNKILEEIK
jgi:5'-nucleotidase